MKIIWLKILNNKIKEEIKFKAFYLRIFQTCLYKYLLINNLIVGITKALINFQNKINWTNVRGFTNSRKTKNLITFLNNLF